MNQTATRKSLDIAIETIDEIKDELADIPAGDLTKAETNILRIIRYWYESAE